MKPTRLLLMLGVAIAGLSAQIDRSVPAFIAKHIEQELASARVPGAAIAIVSGNEVLATGYGIADAETSAPMTPLTLVHTGSLTKLFTALALTAMLDARKLPFDTAVGRHLPGLGSRPGAATFHQLLSQTSGLRDRPGDSGSDDEADLAVATRQLTDGDFVLPGGVVLSYSNLGYALAGAALEALAAKPFADALGEQVLTPLGMERATMRSAEARQRGRASGHRLEVDRPSPLVIRTPANDTRIWPAGYLWVNATDMTRVLSALLNGGRVSGHPGLNTSVISRVVSPHAPMPNVFVGGHYGYGLIIARDRGLLIYEHGGTLPGFSSILRIAPERRLAIAILTNLDNAPLRRVAQVVMAKALDLGDQAPPVRDETQVTPEEMKAFVGVYRNRGTAEIAIRDDRVVLVLDAGPPFAVTRIGSDRYLARPKPGAAGPEFVLRPATGTTPAYLHFALWAYVRSPSM